MRDWKLFSCVVLIFSYLAIASCTDPKDLIAPYHYSRVPKVENLQASVGMTQGGRPYILLTWQFDTLNRNLRSWSVSRNVQDTNAARYVPLEIVRRPALGFPWYYDSSATLKDFVPDSINVYYKVVPNGGDNFVGQTSDVLHVILRKLL